MFCSTPTYDVVNYTQVEACFFLKYGLLLMYKVTSDHERPQAIPFEMASRKI